MLITCPECKQQVSDKAFACPHCGYPISANVPKRRKAPTRMRLPNGFGQISEIKSGNLRNRFRAMVHVGFSEEGKPIAKILKPQGYFSSYNEAYAALLEYHKDPRAFGDKTTLRDIYPKWKEEYLKDRKSKSAERSIKFGYTHCESIIDIPVQNIRQKDLRKVFDDNANIPQGSMTQIRNFLNQIFDYCVLRELIERNPAREYVGKSKYQPPTHHQEFTDDEMVVLWSHAGENIFIDMILVGCYSGWRPSELCLLKTENITEEIMTGGMKTASGIDRIVPIHPKILPLIKRYKDDHNEYLFCRKGRPVKYDLYAKNFAQLMTEYQLDSSHKPHDTRVRFVSALKEAEVDEYLIKRLAGHAIQDITERVYTKRSVEQLKSAVEKIK